MLIKKILSHTLSAVMVLIFVVLAAAVVVSRASGVSLPFSATKSKRCCPVQWNLAFRPAP
ncbi:hypothetical protein [Paenibacillus sonchi]|uniref:hypothetical protein n=1 Tax=Paenibacillus sonchi TaxID=373687 RepID=UPI002D7E40C8|nr:hypothetical protein [Paenibacillus sonchi]